MLVSSGVRKVQIKLTTRDSLWHWTAILAFGGYVLVCFVGFLTLVQPSIEGISTIRLGADSGTYFEVASLLSRGGNAGVALIGVGGNYLGPVLIALALKSGWLIALFNLLLFSIAVYIVASIPGVDRWMFAFLLALDAETFVSIITLNKEIFALLSVTLFAKYIYSERKSLWLLAIILILGLFARWQQVVITFACLFMVRPGSFCQKHPKTALAAVVLLIGFAYPIALSHENLESFTEQGDTGGTITLLNAMQAHYLYPVTIFPKVAMSLFGRLLSPGYFLGAYWDSDFYDLQNQFAIHLHTLATFMLCVIAAMQRKLRLSEPLIFFCALYLAATAVTPFIQPRYQYPVYTLLCLEIARRRTPGDTLAYPRAHRSTPKRRRLQWRLLQLPGPGVRT